MLGFIDVYGIRLIRLIPFKRTGYSFIKNKTPTNSLITLNVDNLYASTRFKHNAQDSDFTGYCSDKHDVFLRPNCHTSGFQCRKAR